MTQQRPKRMKRMRMRMKIIFNNRMRRELRQIVVSWKSRREDKLIRLRMISAQTRSAILMDQKI